MTYKRFKQITWVLGTNDSMHCHQHCLDDRSTYLKLLYSESKRIFPSATINFVTPFHGLKGVSKQFIDELDRDIKLSCPKMRRHHPPQMHNKVGKSEIHLNREGRGMFLHFLRNRFIVKKQRVFSSNSGRETVIGVTSQDRRSPYSVAHNTDRVTEKRVASQDRMPPYSAALNSEVQSERGNGHRLAWEVADKASKLFPQRNHGYNEQRRGNSDSDLVQAIVERVGEMITHQNFLNSYYPRLPPRP